MRAKLLIIYCIVSCPVGVGAQNLDINDLTDDGLKTGVRPLVGVLVLVSGGVVGTRHEFLEKGGVSLTVGGAAVMPSSDGKAGAVGGEELIAIPLVQVGLGVARGIELSGRFSVRRIGNREVVFKGYGVRYSILNSGDGSKSVAVSFMVNSASGPEDFRLRDLSAHLTFSKRWGGVSLAAEVGGDYPELSVDVKAGGNLLEDHNESVVRALGWAGVTASTELSGAVWAYAGWLQQKKEARFSAGIGVRL